MDEELDEDFASIEMGVRLGESDGRRGEVWKDLASTAYVERGAKEMRSEDGEVEGDIRCDIDGRVDGLEW